MKKTFRTAARLLVMFLTYMAALLVIKKHLTQNVDLLLSIGAALIAVLLEAAFCRYFKSSYGCTSWTFCTQRKSIRPGGTSITDDREKRMFPMRIGMRGVVRSGVSLAMAVFFLFIIITGVCESINKLLSIEVAGRAYLAATTLCAFLTPYLFKSYQAIGEVQ